eukprot:Nk52_evm49s2657 gene=Nk52_evmTU49s2657
MAVDAFLNTVIKISGKATWERCCCISRTSGICLFVFEDKNIRGLLKNGKTIKNLKPIDGIKDLAVQYSTSTNGKFICALLSSGEILIWDCMQDEVTYVEFPRIGSGNDFGDLKDLKYGRYSLFLNDSGDKLVVITAKSEIYVWQSIADSDKDAGRYTTGRWVLVPPKSNNILPGAATEIRANTASFYIDQGGNERANCTFVFVQNNTFHVVNAEMTFCTSNDPLYPERLPEIKWILYSNSLSTFDESLKPNFGGIKLSWNKQGDILAIAINQLLSYNCCIMYFSVYNQNQVLLKLGPYYDADPMSWDKEIWTMDLCWTADSLLLGTINGKGQMLICSKLGKPLDLRLVNKAGKSLPQNTLLSLKLPQNFLKQTNLKFSLKAHPIKHCFIACVGSVVYIIQFNELSYGHIIRKLASTENCLGIRSTLLKDFASLGPNLGQTLLAWRLLCSSAAFVDETEFSSCAELIVRRTTIQVQSLLQKSNSQEDELSILISSFGLASKSIVWCTFRSAILPWMLSLAQGFFTVLMENEAYYAILHLLRITQHSLKYYTSICFPGTVPSAFENVYNIQGLWNQCISLCAHRLSICENEEKKKLLKAILGALRHKLKGERIAKSPGNVIKAVSEKNVIKRDADAAFLEGNIEKALELYSELGQDGQFYKLLCYLHEKDLKNALYIMYDSFETITCPIDWEEENLVKERPSQFPFVKPKSFYRSKSIIQIMCDIIKSYLKGEKGLYPSPLSIPLSLTPSEITELADIRYLSIGHASLKTAVESSGTHVHFSQMRLCLILLNSGLLEECIESLEQFRCWKQCVGILHMCNHYIEDFSLEDYLIDRFEKILARNSLADSCVWSTFCGIAKMRACIDHVAEVGVCALLKSLVGKPVLPLSLKKGQIASLHDPKPRLLLANPTEEIAFWIPAFVVLLSQGGITHLVLQKCSQYWKENGSTVDFETISILLENADIDCKPETNTDSSELILNCRIFFALFSILKARERLWEILYQFPSMNSKKFPLKEVSEISLYLALFPHWKDVDGLKTLYFKCILKMEENADLAEDIAFMYSLPGKDIRGSIEKVRKKYLKANISLFGVGEPSNPPLSPGEKGDIPDINLAKAESYCFIDNLVPLVRFLLELRSAKETFVPIKTSSKGFESLDCLSFAGISSSVFYSTCEWKDSSGSTAMEIVSNINDECGHPLPIVSMLDEMKIRDIFILNCLALLYEKKTGRINSGQLPSNESTRDEVIKEHDSIESESPAPEMPIIHITEESLPPSPLKTVATSCKEPDISNDTTPPVIEHNLGLVTPKTSLGAEDRTVPSTRPAPVFEETLKNEEIPSTTTEAPVPGTYRNVWNQSLEKLARNELEALLKQQHDAVWSILSLQTGSVKEQKRDSPPLDVDIENETLAPKMLHVEQRDYLNRPALLKLDQDLKKSDNLSPTVREMRTVKTFGRESPIEVRDHDPKVLLRLPLIAKAPTPEFCKPQLLKVPFSRTTPTRERNGSFDDVNQRLPKTQKSYDAVFPKHIPLRTPQAPFRERFVLLKPSQTENYSEERGIAKYSSGPIDRGVNVSFSNSPLPQYAEFPFLKINRRQGVDPSEISNDDKSHFTERKSPDKIPTDRNPRISFVTIKGADIPPARDAEVSPHALSISESTDSFSHNSKKTVGTSINDNLTAMRLQNARQTQSVLQSDALTRLTDQLYSEVTKGVKSSYSQSVGFSAPFFVEGEKDQSSTGTASPLQPLEVSVAIIDPSEPVQLTFPLDNGSKETEFCSVLDVETFHDSGDIAMQEREAKSKPASSPEMKAPEEQPKCSNVKGSDIGNASVLSGTTLNAKVDQLDVQLESILKKASQLESNLEAEQGNNFMHPQFRENQDKIEVSDGFLLNHREAVKKSVAEARARHKTLASRPRNPIKALPKGGEKSRSPSKENEHNTNENLSIPLNSEKLKPHTFATGERVPFKEISDDSLNSSFATLLSSSPIRQPSPKATSAKAKSPNKSPSVKKAELREWMKAKRREQHLKFLQERENKIKKEKRPFRPDLASGPVEKVTHENRLDEQIQIRLEEAYDLMSDIVDGKDTWKKALPNQRYKVSPSNSFAEFYEDDADAFSTTSGSIMSNIDWAEVDRILNE